MCAAKRHNHYILFVLVGATENAGVENAIRSKMQGCNMQEWKNREQIAGVENAGVEKSGANRRAGKCRSWVAVWEAERRLFRETALNYLLTIVCSFLTE